MLLFLVVLQSRGMDLVEILSFLFQLSFSTLGRVILHFMVGSPSAAVSQDLAQLLIQAGLMRSEAGDAPCITSAGFQFLLLDTASQLWYFTLQYLKTAEVGLNQLYCTHPTYTHLSETWYTPQSSNSR
ncbi:General transcription factor IIH subunit 4 [Acipenser ruthenus]|uniref:General transcription factor IIH subunit 4 n=1 Tax=Acipenser ruthenus TaxID=7906 RepID=A0A444UUY3_ACIRT|nr:General transcription factor IIH subunit 4 [Acipenser ruthenus]